MAGALWLSLFPSLAFSQSGFYSNFEKLIEIQNENYGKKMERLAGAPSSLADLAAPEEAELDPDFLNSMIFHTPSRYASLGGADKCGLYDLILSNLARGPKGELQNFIVRYKAKAGEIKTVAVTRSVFFEKIAFKQCPQVEKFQAYFSLKNLPATLKTVNLDTPVSQKSCEAVHGQFRKDPKTPYLCYLYEQVEGIENLENEIRTTPRSQYRKLQKAKKELKVSKAYKKLLNPSSLDYLGSLCQNLESPKAFCDGFFKSSFWRRAARNEKPKEYMQAMCSELLGKKKLSDATLTQSNYENCARKLESEPALCQFSGKNEPALTPKPDCGELSLNLNLTRLSGDYLDCPAMAGNSGVVTLARLISHFENKAPKPSSFCPASLTEVFARFNTEVSDGRFWQIAMCYDDKIINEEVCHPTVYGVVDDSDLSITKVVEKILRRTKGFGPDQTCRLISKSEYRPQLLEFKSGCFIMLDPKECRGTDCKAKILLDQKEVTHIKQKSGTTFDYFPKDFANENFAQVKLIQQKYKLKSSKVTNVSSLKRALEKSPKALVHGVGCAEDLLPEHFSKNSFNQCTPLSFIIDGYKERRGIYSVTLRSGYDSVHAPRLVPWSHLFSALKDYQRLHPLNVWGLNVLY